MSRKSKWKFGKCRLCLQEGELCHSHVYPAFFVRMAKGGNEILHGFSRAPKKSYTQCVQDIRKEHLLCFDCEQKFCGWEKYSKESYFDHALPWMGGFGCHEVEIDYVKFKSFQLSILWRIAIAQGRLFRNCDLPLETCERIREVLYQEQCVDPDFYACELVSMPRTGFAASVTDQFITGPRVSEPEIFSGQEVRNCRFILGGHIWHYYLAESFPEILPRTLQASGRHRVLVNEAYAHSVFESEIFDPITGDMNLFERHARKQREKGR